MVKEGASVYKSECAECHGLNGEGQWQDHDAAPRLAGKLAPLSVERIAVLITRGGSYMPRFDSLSHREIAAVATFVRNSFGNNHGIATEEEVAGYR
ncbi:MAG: cytochrome c [Boseongicola sp.]|nr:cytochrome c [Boseongicola sp.]